MIELQNLEVYKFIGIEVTLSDCSENYYNYKHKMNIYKYNYPKKVVELNEKKYKSYHIDTEQRDSKYKGSSYENYNGYNGWSDDVIDSAFEGDPENTWNVD